MSELIAAVLAVLIYRLGMYDAHRKKKNEREYDLLLSNIERYDGTGEGQKSIRKSRYIAFGNEKG